MARPRRSSSPSTLWWLAGLMLLVAALYAWLSGQPVVPPDGGSVFYPFVMLYSFTVTPLAVVLALAAMLVVGLWLPLVMARQKRAFLSSVAVIVALGASGLACWSTLPQTLAPYRHLDRATYNDHVYQLGLRAVPQTSEVYYVLCTCDPSGLSCRCRDLVATTPAAVTAPPRLVVDAAANRFAVQVGETTVYAFTP